jgi:solute carrier family 25 phosphate transporter 23/24/25/41
VGVDVTGRNIMPPDRRKDGPPWGHFVAGGTAGMVSKTLSSPLHVIAIRIATATVDAPLAGALSVIPKAAAQVWAKDGLRGFWRGNFTNSLSSAPGKAIDFFSYALFKSLLTKVRKRVKAVSSA